MYAILRQLERCELFARIPGDFDASASGVEPAAAFIRFRDDAELY